MAMVVLDHIWQELLECKRLSQKVDIHGSFDLLGRRIQDRFAVDDGCVVDQDCGFPDILADLLGDASNLLRLGYITDVAFNVHCSRRSYRGESSVQHVR